MEGGMEGGMMEGGWWAGGSEQKGDAALKSGGCLRCRSMGTGDADATAAIELGAMQSCGCAIK